MKRIVILGAGESGAGAAVLAKKEGFDVFVSDMSKIAAKYQKLLDTIISSGKKDIIQKKRFLMLTKSSRVQVFQKPLQW